MSDITLEEALQDYIDNERDIQIFRLMIEAHWTSIVGPRSYLQEALEMRSKIATVIEKLGGTVPNSSEEAQE